MGDVNSMLSPCVPARTCPARHFCCSRRVFTCLGCRCVTLFASLPGWREHRHVSSCAALHLATRTGRRLCVTHLLPRAFVDAVAELTGGGLVYPIACCCCYRFADAPSHQRAHQRRVFWRTACLNAAAALCAVQSVCSRGAAVGRDALPWRAFICGAGINGRCRERCR